jgi:Type I phosphodiesterase / nucleotide pyrophosphatase
LTVLTLMLLAGPAISLGQLAKRSSSASRVTKPEEATAAARRRFLDMFVRANFPGRSGQLLVVPREGEVLTRPDADVAYMHGSPWPYDVSIPLMFAGPGVKPGVYTMPATQQDVAPTLAAALGVSISTATGRVLPVLRTGLTQPRVVFLLVLDGMRRDYFDRYADVMPVLSALRRRAAWFSHAEVNYLPTNTAVGHSTIATGADPRVHGIPVINIYDRVHHRSQDLFAGMAPQSLTALTLADVWQLTTSGQAVILAQGSINRAATPLAGHGACQPNGVPVVFAGYDESTGGWRSNPDCFRLPDYLKDRNAKTLWSAQDEWLHHRIDSPAAVRRSALFPAFEADAMTAMIEREPVGKDSVPDLILLNYKGADFVGHRYGPNSEELRLTLGEMDRNLARIIGALEAKVGKDYLLALTADHGMPSAPPDHRHMSRELVDLLNVKFDPQAKQLVTSYEPENAQMFVDEDRLSYLGLTLWDLARFIEAQKYIFAVFTEDEVRHEAEIRARR